MGDIYYNLFIIRLKLGGRYYNLFILSDLQWGQLQMEFNTDWY